MEKEKTDRKRHPHACSKGELAQRYLPHITQAAARRTVRAWIDSNPEFKATLVRAGYTEKGIILTPIQIQIHYDFLGEP